MSYNVRISLHQYLLSVIKSCGVGEDAHFHNEAVGLSHSDEEWIWTKIIIEAER